MATAADLNGRQTRGRDAATILLPTPAAGNNGVIPFVSNGVSSMFGQLRALSSFASYRVLGIKIKCQVFYQGTALAAQDTAYLVSATHPSLSFLNQVGGFTNTDTAVQRTQSTVMVLNQPRVRHKIISYTNMITPSHHMTVKGSGRKVIGDVYSAVEREWYGATGATAGALTTAIADPVNRWYIFFYIAPVPNSAAAPPGNGYGMRFKIHYITELFERIGQSGDF